MSTIDPAKVLADIHQRLAKLGDGKDARSDNERDAYAREFSALDRRRMTIRDAVPDIARLDPQIAAVEAWIGHMKTWREECCDEMAKLPPRAVDRDREQEQQMLALIASVKTLDFGTGFVDGHAMIPALLREKICGAYAPTWEGSRDPWQVGFGPLPMAERSLDELTKNRNKLQASLDEAMRETATVTS